MSVTPVPIPPCGIEGSVLVRTLSGSVLRARIIPNSLAFSHLAIKLRFRVILPDGQIATAWYLPERCHDDVCLLEEEANHFDFDYPRRAA